MIIAQISGDMVKDVAGWLVCFGALIWIFNQAKEAWGGLIGSPAHPPNEQLEASQHDLTRRIGDMEQDIDSLHTKIGSSERETRRQLDEKTTRLSTEITTVSLQVSGIAATNADQSTQLTIINSDIKKILVALPRQSGGHHG